MRIGLCENVVSEDYLEDTTLHYFTYATAWTDEEHIKEFDSKREAVGWYKMNLKDKAIAQGKYWLEEDGDLRENILDQDALDEWENVVLTCMMEDN